MVVDGLFLEVELMLGGTQTKAPRRTKHNSIIKTVKVIGAVFISSGY